MRCGINVHYTQDDRPPTLRSKEIRIGKYQPQSGHRSQLTKVETRLASLLTKEDTISRFDRIEALLMGKSHTPDSTSGEQIKLLRPNAKRIILTMRTQQNPIRTKASNTVKNQ
jgi:hypothetical protein